MTGNNQKTTVISVLQKLRSENKLGCFILFAAIWIEEAAIKFLDDPVFLAAWFAAIGFVSDPIFKGIAVSFFLGEARRTMGRRTITTYCNIIVY